MSRIVNVAVSDVDIGGVAVEDKAVVASLVVVF